MKIHLLLILIITFSFSVFAQNKSKTLASCPAISLQNLQLGMTTDEVKKILSPKMLIKIDPELPLADFTKSDYSTYPATPGFQMISLKFYKNILYRITIFYDDSIRILGIDDFAKLLSNGLKINRQWKVVKHPPLYDYATIDCGTSTLRAERMKISYFATVEDKDFSQLESSLKEQIRQKTFKP